jgi:hypothetical protein
MLVFVDNGEILLSSEDDDIKLYRRSDLVYYISEAALGDTAVSVINSFIAMNDEGEAVVRSSSLSSFTLALSSSIISYSTRKCPYFALLSKSSEHMLYELVAYRDSILPNSNGFTMQRVLNPAILTSDAVQHFTKQYGRFILNQAILSVSDDSYTGNGVVNDVSVLVQQRMQNSWGLSVDIY